MKGYAIVATGTTISGDVKLSSFRDENKNLDLRFEAKGSVSFVGADIGGSLWCSRASFKLETMDKMDSTGTALDFSGAKIKADVNLDSPLAKDELFEAKGTVQFASARIGGNVKFWGCRDPERKGPGH